MLEGKRRNVWESMWSNSWLDLHLMSSGAARAMLRAWLSFCLFLVWVSNKNVVAGQSKAASGYYHFGVVFFLFVE